MACKNSLPQKHCGDCFHINRDAYRGVGKAVCYELESRDGKKVATTVSETKKACNKFRAVKNMGKAV